jgi:Ca-activated chloride channel homolog
LSVPRPLLLPILTLCGLQAASAGPQDEPPPAATPRPPVFSVDLEVVNITVTVRDSTGALVKDLQRDDFTVLEDGRPQTIELFGRAHDPGEDETMALDLGILFDTSESMLDVLRLTRQAAVRFLDTIPRARDLTTIFFDEDIRISRYDSENQQGLVARIQAQEGGGNTALYDAITVYLSRVQDARGRKVLVLFSDGEDSMSEVSPSELLYLVRSSSVTIYPIAFQSLSLSSSRSLRSLAFLNQLAEVSGGRVFNPRVYQKLGEIYDQILDELEAQYVLGFVPQDREADGRFRKLEVKVARPGLSVRCRKGYYAEVPREAASR